MGRRGAAIPQTKEASSRSLTGRAFTLLEVMIALAILSGAMLAVSQMTSAALRNHTRAVRLEVATLLARGKLASLQEGFDKDGFRDFDQVDDGSFDADGHPEVRWKLEVLKPRLELGPDQLLAVLAGSSPETGGVDLAALLGGKAQSSADKASGLETLFPGAAAVAGLMRMQLTKIGEQLKQGLREVRLTVSWRDGAHDESFTVVTHVTAFAKGVTP